MGTYIFINQATNQQTSRKRIVREENHRTIIAINWGIVEMER